LSEVVIERIEFRLIEPIVLTQFGVQALERLEVMTLPGVIQRLTKVEILDRICRSIGLSGAA
jgi:hypothetical protein